MSIKECYKNIVNKIPISIDETCQFVYNVCKSLKPDTTIQITDVVKVFQMGMGGMLLNASVSAIRDNPSKFDLDITELIDKNGNLLKITVE